MRRTRARFALLVAAFVVLTAAAGAAHGVGPAASGSSTNPAPGTAAYERTGWTSQPTSFLASMTRTRCETGGMAPAGR